MSARAHSSPSTKRRAVTIATRWLACGLIGMAGAWAGPARSGPELSSPIVSQPLSEALAEFAHQTGLQLLYESKLAVQRRSHEAAAGTSAANALTEMLRDTGLNFQFLNPKTVRIYEPEAVAPTAQPSTIDLPKSRSEPVVRRVDALDQILVTGTRREEHLSDVEDIQNIAASVSVVGGPSLEAGNAAQLSDYSANLPGLNVIGGGMPGASGVAIRSVSPLVLATAVAFYIDDVPIGASGRWGYAGGTALDLLPFDLERLEVQRGPQGTYGGAGAEIGSIKYVLNAPDASRFEARIGADVNAIRGASEPGEYLRALVNAPLVDGRLAVRATAYDSHTPGYIDNAVSGATSINGLRQYGGRIAASWRPAESLSLRLMALDNRIDQASTSEQLSPSVANVPGSGDAYIVKGTGSDGDLTDGLAFLTPFRKSLDAYSATLRWNPGFAEFLSVTGWSRQHEHYVEDYSLIDGSFFPELSHGAVPAGLAKLVEDVQLDKWTEELRLTSSSGGSLDWVLGAFFTRERLEEQWVENAFDTSYHPIAAFSPYLGTLNRPSAFNELAVYGDMTWELGDRFEAAGGIRIADDHQNYTNLAAGTLGQQDTTNRAPAAVVTWMTNVRYRLAPTAMVYGRFATGSQPNAILVPQPGISGAQQGETAANYEIGVKSEFLDRRALMDLTLYYLDRTRMLTAVYESGVFHAAANGGTAAAHGLELTSSYAPLPGLTFAYNAAYTHCAFTQINSSAPYQLTGFQLENIPTWDMSISVDYDWALPNRWHARAGGAFRFVGKEWASYVQSRSNGGYPTTQLPAYTALDLHAAASHGPLSLKIYARNLADQRAVLNSNVIVNDFNTPVRVENYILQPRSIGVGIDYVF